MVISILDIKRKPTVDNGANICSRMVRTIKGIGNFEALNILMIIAVFIDLGLKYSYDLMAVD